MSNNEKRRFDYRSVRPTKTYTIEEAAAATGKNPHTIYAWIADGLPIIDDQKPTMIYGHELKGWLRDWWEKRRQKCADNEFYCCHCQKVQPAECGTIQFSEWAVKNIRGKARCSVCGTTVYKNFKVAQALQISTAGKNPLGEQVRFNRSDTSTISPTDTAGFNCSNPDLGNPAFVAEPTSSTQGVGRIRLLANALPKNPRNERLKAVYFRYLLHSSGRSPKSILKDEAALLRFEAFFKYADFGRFDEKMAIAYKTHFQAQSLKSVTILAELKCVQRFLVWLAKGGGGKCQINLLTIEFLNLSMNERRAAQAPPEKAFPTVDDAKQALMAMPNLTSINKRDRAMFSLVAITGIRDGALVTLKVKHFHPARRLLYQDPREVATKFGKQIHSFLLDIDAQFEGAFLEWYRHLIEDLHFGPNDPLFPKSCASRTGGKDFIGQRSVGREHFSDAQPVVRMFRGAFRRVGLPEYTPHRMRDMLVSEMYKRELTISEFKAWSQNLGHATPKTTLTSYGAISPQEQEQLVRRRPAIPVEAPVTKDDLRRLEKLIIESRPKSSE